MPAKRAPAKSAKKPAKTAKAAKKPVKKAAKAGPTKEQKERVLRAVHRPTKANHPIIDPNDPVVKAEHFQRTHAEAVPNLKPQAAHPPTAADGLAKDRRVARLQTVSNWFRRGKGR